LAKKIMVLGHKGMVGAAIARKLRSKKYEVMTSDADLRSQAESHNLFVDKPDYVFICAAKVGGIGANFLYPVDFLYDNTMIAMNVLRLANQAEIQNVMYLGSSCIYPKHSPQPMKEEHLLTGALEPTNEAYAIAKISGIKLCEAYNRQYGRNYVPVMPTNLYGIGDKYDLNNSHVIPALIRKAYEAREKKLPTMEVWGSGKPRREFMYAEDLADACVFLMEKDYRGGLINIGSGQETTIKSIAEMICRIARYEGQLQFDTSKPDGTPRKLLDSSKLMDMGWQAKTSLADGLNETFKDFMRRYLIRGEI
jgi:GDP-L-fucose synthase